MLNEDPLTTFLVVCFPGEVIVWDTGREDDTVIYSSRIGDDSHREPVSKVHWVVDPESKGKQYQVS